MKFKAAASTDQGNYREDNQDAFVVENEINFFALADGVGGNNAGEVASINAVSCLSNLMHRLQSSIPYCKQQEIQELLKKAVQETNKRIYLMAEQDQKLKGMATTLCILYFLDLQAYYCNYGDSRIYLLRDQQIYLLTIDHAIQYEHTGLDSHRPLAKKVLTHALGQKESAEPSIQVLTLQDGDRFLIATDGLFEQIREAFISRVLLQDVDPQHQIKELILAARKNGALDNITIIVIHVSA